LQASTVPPSGAPAKTINLALQGGGAHGAFTRSVLDALNAVVLADSPVRVRAEFM
jgi:predicted acylesterase/phospholipase RssA